MHWTIGNSSWCSCAYCAVQFITVQIYVVQQCIVDFIIVELTVEQQCIVELIKVELTVVQLTVVQQCVLHSSVHCSSAHWSAAVYSSAHRSAAVSNAQLSSSKLSWGNCGWKGRSEGSVGGEGFSPLVKILVATFIILHKKSFLVLLTVVLLLRRLIRAPALYSYFAPAFSHSVVFNDFVMPSLFPASSLLIPHKSIRFCSIVSKARGFGCRMGLWRKCFKLVSTLSTSSSLLHCFTLLGSTLSTSVLHIPSGAAWPLTKDRYLQGRQI